MRQYKLKTKEFKDLNQIVCNCCGKQIPVADGYAREGVFSVDYTWGYFSKKDGEIHSFDLCEECYDNMLRQFRIPAEIQNGE